MNALEFLISVLASLSALLTVLAAYKVMHSATNLKFSERALPQLKDRYLSNEDCDISSDTDVVKTVGIIRDSVSLLNKGLANTSESVKWYLPLLDNEFKASLVSTLSKCLHMPGNELSKQIIETLYASTSVFLRAAKQLGLTNDVQLTIDEYAKICSIAKCKIELCNAYEKSSSTVTNVNTYKDDSDLANKQISDKNILVG